MHFGFPGAENSRVLTHAHGMNRLFEALSRFSLHVPRSANASPSTVPSGGHLLGTAVQATRSRCLSVFAGNVLEKVDCLIRCTDSTRYDFTQSAAGGDGGGKKVKQVWRCTSCNQTQLNWSGCCSCGVWNSMVAEAVVEPSKSSGGGGGAMAARAATSNPTLPKPWTAPKVQPQTPARSGTWVRPNDRPESIAAVTKRKSSHRWRLPMPGPTGEELSRVLGGGIVPGSLTLIGGDPGVGKSTLLLQLAGILAATEADPDDEDPLMPLAGNLCVLYVSGEESVEQIGSRAERMGLQGSENVFLHSATRLEDVLQEIVTMQPRAVIVDSIQTLYLDAVSGSAGSITQVKECTTALLHLAKRERVPIFLVGHVTKQGEIAGPRVLEHIVDVVLYMEGERQQMFRLLRGIKNRFGRTDEVGVFTMDDAGLQPVSNPSVLFMNNTSLSNGVGSAVCVLVEGTRPLLAEVQALCTKNYSTGNIPPHRSHNGIVRTSMEKVMAILERHVRVKMYRMNVILNVVGGLKVYEPASDLAIAVALTSSVWGQPVKPKTAVIGELGLKGELRPVANLERRVLEAAKLGFRTCVVPAASAKVDFKRLKGMEIIEHTTVEAALKAVLGPAPSEAASE